jgi:peptidoglycan/xylan/chitin deacetylase (PgdA/CDA1 family)
MIGAKGPAMFRKNPAAIDAIALTFDDGPCATATPDVLDLLNGQSVRTTFFMIGESVRRYPDLAEQVLREGHQIANHSDRHTAVRSLSPAACLREIEKAERTFRSILGLAPRFYRPPKGLVHRSVTATVNRAGYHVVTWSLMPGDYFAWHTADWIKRRLAKVRPGDIIVLHDGLSLQPAPDRSRTLSVLSGFISGVKNRGLRFVSLAELLGLPPYFEPQAPGPGRPRATDGSPS